MKIEGRRAQEPARQWHGLRPEAPWTGGRGGRGECSVLAFGADLAIPSPDVSASHGWGGFSAAALTALCVMCLQEGVEGRNPTKTETAGEGSQLSNKGVTEATNRLDPEGTLHRLDSSHFVLQNTERHWRDGSSRRGLGLDGWRIPANSQDFYQ